MHTLALAALLTILVGALTACSGGNAPTAPTPTPAAPQIEVGPTGGGTTGPGSGTIAIREISPSDTALTIGDCALGPSNRRCAGPWSGTFDVLVNRDMTYAVLTVGFYNGQTICGYGANTADVVPQGRLVSFTIRQVFVSDEFGTFVQPCQFPATTTHLVAELWSDSSSWSNTLIQELPGAYTLRSP